ncbi:MAG: excinuclease ABC subunit UvrC [Candidatus Omnitrophica bacterium]|nr:excinuclease ABC subunit UvrC [Candidatus Omnitrophota bacterium]
MNKRKKNCWKKSKPKVVLLMSLSEKIKALPLTSGVYLMKDAAGKIIYVGKAVSLRKRVGSYFRSSGHEHIKTDQLVREIADIDILETASEAEALILEASLVKQYNPKYNIDLKDDKSYPYIVITDDEFPRVSIARPRHRQPGYLYYGPYVDAKLIREALVIIRKIFPFCTCKTFPTSECLNYHLGLCEAPCVGKVCRENYSRNIHNIRLILEGKKDELYRDLKRAMEDCAQNKDYEQAAKTRDQLRAIGALYSGTKDANYFKEVEQLERALSLPRPPERIEAFDISTIYGQQSVGSMVSFLNGRPDKNNYRRFRIKTVTGIDDFQMIAEVVRRRYTRLKKEGAAFPDLVLIDGGKGQLSSAVEELKKLKVDIPIASLAKREEEIFLPGKRDSIKLPAQSLALKLVQRVRDEAHRFAITYHRKLRAKKTFKLP